MKLWNKKDKELYRVYFKKNGCSMLMFEKLSYYADWKGHFVVTK